MAAPHCASVSSLVKGDCGDPDLAKWCLNRQETVSTDIHSPHLLPAQFSEARFGVSLWAPHLPPLPFAAQGQSEGGGFYGAGNQTGSGAQRGPPLAAGVGPLSSQPLNFGLGAGRGQGQGRTLMIFPSFYNLLESSLRQGRQHQQGLCLLSYGGDRRPVSKHANR